MKECVFNYDGLVEVTGTGSGLAFNVGGGYIRCVGGQPTVVAHKSSSTFCHIGVENNTNARAFLAIQMIKTLLLEEELHIQEIIQVILEQIYPLIKLIMR